MEIAKPTQKKPDIAEQRASILKFLSNANKDRKQGVEFELKFDNDEVMYCEFRICDILDLPEKESLLYEEKLKLCRNKGLDNEPIDDNEWEKFFNGRIDAAKERNKKAKNKEDKIDLEKLKQNLVDQKPLTRAHQKALSLTRQSILQEIIPDIIRVKVNEECGYIPLPQDAKDEFKIKVLGSRELSTAIISKYLELSELYMQSKDEAKN